MLFYGLLWREMCITYTVLQTSQWRSVKPGSMDISENFEIRPGFNSALLNNSCIAMCMQFICYVLLAKFSIIWFRAPKCRSYVLIITFTYVGLLKLLTCMFIIRNL